MDKAGSWDYKIVSLVVFSNELIDEENPLVLADGGFPKSWN